MPDFLVGSGQTYTTIQGAIDAVVALGDLAGLGAHDIIVDAGHIESGALDLTLLQAKADGLVTIKAASLLYYLQLDAQITPQSYVTLKDFDAIANIGFTGDALIRTSAFPLFSFVTNFYLRNPNNIAISGIFGAVYAEDGVISDFNGTFKHGAQELKSAERLSLAGNYRGFRQCVNIIDSVSVDSTDYDFNSNTTVSYCASEDATATGTGSIINIDPLVEFVDADNGDYSLKPTSQLIGAGSTGNDIGYYQAPPAPSITSIDADNKINVGQGTFTMLVENLPAGAHTFSATIGGEAATYSSRSGDTFTFTQTAGIDGLTPNDPADDPDVDGYATTFTYLEA